MKFEEKAPVITALFAYWIFLAMCYLLAYWNQFGINVFELAGLTDFAKLAIFPVALSALAAGGGMVVNACGAMFVKSGEKWARKMPERFVSTFGSLYPFLTTGSAIFALTLIIVMDRPIRWVAAAFLFVPFTTSVIHQLGLRAFLPSTFLRAAFSAMVGIFPFFVVADAEIRALSIKKGTARLIVAKTGVAASLTATEAAPIFYIGLVGGTYVLYESATKSVVLTKQIDAAPLILTRNPNRRERSPAGAFDVLLQHY